MEKKRKHKTIIIALLLILSLVLAYFAASRIIQLNEKYPGPSLMEYETGEEVIGGGIGITVNGMSLASSGEITKLSPSLEQNLTDEERAMLKTGSIKLLIVDMTIKNYNTEKKDVPLYDFCATSGIWYNFIDPLAFHDLNKEKEVLQSLDAGEVAELKLTYPLYAHQFRDENEWKDDENRRYDLLLSTYPARCVVHVSEGEKN